MSCRSSPYRHLSLPLPTFFHLLRVPATLPASHSLFFSVSNLHWSMFRHVKLSLLIFLLLLLLFILFLLLLARPLSHSRTLPDPSPLLAPLSSSSSPFYNPSFAINFFLIIMSFRSHLLHYFRYTHIDEKEKDCACVFFFLCVKKERKENKGKREGTKERYKK